MTENKLDIRVSDDLKRCGINYTKILGKGSFGVVLQVNDKALKFMDTSNLSSLNSSITEIAIAKQYRFPHFLPYQGGIFYGRQQAPYCTEHGIGYYMPMAKSDLNNAKVVGPALLRSYHDVLDALADMHFYHLTHNDIKPGNMLTTQIKGYMSDLGSIVINTDFKDSARTTYIFAAPEVYKEYECDYYSTCKYTMPSDMWAMGMSLFIKCYRNNEILFDSTEEHRKYYSKMKKFPLEKFQLYDWAIPYKNNIEDYLRKILVIDPSKRLTAEEALQHPLFANLPEQEGLNKQPYSISYKPIDENVMLRIINTMGKALNQLPNHEDLPILILDYIYRLLAVSKLSKNDPEQLIICTGIIICSLLNLDYDKKFYKEKNSVAALLSRDVPFYNDNLLSLCKNSKEKAYLYKKYYCQPKAFFSLVCKNAIVPNIKEDIETMETVISRIKLEI